MWLQATGLIPNNLAGICQIPGGESHNYAALRCSVDSSNNLCSSHNKLCTLAVHLLSAKLRPFPAMLPRSEPLSAVAHHLRPGWSRRLPDPGGSPATSPRTANWHYLLWTLLMLELWHWTYVDDDREMASFRRTGHEAARVMMGG